MKLPTKQIYLLVIIIGGIIGLSAYSTYAIFTYDKSTSDIVSLHTPNSLKIDESLVEYKQIIVPKNSYITTDIDLYNTFDYEICYSIWYQLVGNSVDTSKVKVYQKNTGNNLSSGTLSGIDNTRITLVITNDNDYNVSIKIGIASAKNEATCLLNIESDKSVITTSLSSYQELIDVVKNDQAGVYEEENYLTYQNINNKITLNKEIYLSDTYSYHDEMFSLLEPVSISDSDSINYQSDENKSYYTCLEDTSCKFLYKINKIEKLDDKETYELVNYDLLKGYLNTTSGVRKITTNSHDNYLYYGDNPQNFIYYNCTNEEDTSTCELWRIIGLTYDQNENNYLIKIVRNDQIGMYSFSDKESNQWNDSNILKVLNDYQVKNSNYLYDFTYRQPYLKDLVGNIDSVNLFDISIKTKFQIINLSDYLYASSCQVSTIDKYDKECLRNNWLNNNDGKLLTMTAKISETTVSPLEEETDIEPETIITNHILSVSNTIEEEELTTKLSVRPVAYLKSRILVVGGNGSLENPYIIR